MKVLVATKESQGARDEDIWDDCVEGELVWLAEPCGRVDPDSADHCTCATTFVGVASGKLTTTARVRDIPGLGRAAYLRALKDGHTKCCHPGCSSIARHAEELIRAADGLPVDEVLERWNDWIAPRFDDQDGALEAPLRIRVE